LSSRKDVNNKKFNDINKNIKFFKNNMSNTLSFLLGIILTLTIIVFVSALSRSSKTVAEVYRPVACDGVIGD